MVNIGCLGGISYSNYVSPSELFNSVILMFSALFLVYVFFNVRSQRKKKVNYSITTDSNEIDVLMQPRNKELIHYNSENLPFVNKPISLLRFIFWSLVLLTGLIILYLNY